MFQSFFLFAGNIQVLVFLFAFFNIHSKVDLYLNIIILFIACFSHQHQPMVFHLSLSDTKSPQLSKTVLSIMADFNNAEVWMVSTQPLISNSYSTNSLVTVSSAPIIIRITITFIASSVLAQGLDTYLSFRFPSVLSSGQPERYYYHYYYYLLF